MRSETRLIVGLGNPGKKYEYTRHNLGFLTVQYLAGKFNLRFKTSSLTTCLTAEGNFDGEKVFLLLPSAYMNNSGVAVRQILAKKGFSLNNVIIICDDLNLDFGQTRIRPRGSDGGHNGLSSVFRCLCTEEIARLRMGISNVRRAGQTGNSEISAKNDSCREKEIVDYVLGKFTKKERMALDNFIQEAANCCLVWLRDGINKAMEQFNRRK